MVQRSYVLHVNKMKYYFDDKCTSQTHIPMTDIELVPFKEDKLDNIPYEWNIAYNSGCGIYGSFTTVSLKGKILTIRTKRNIFCLSSYFKENIGTSAISSINVEVSKFFAMVFYLYLCMISGSVILSGVVGQLFVGIESSLRYLWLGLICVGAIGVFYSLIFLIISYKWKQVVITTPRSVIKLPNVPVENAELLTELIFNERHHTP